LKYGNPKKKTWAVVTGGSDGIGFAICKKLAKEGFNICIISRNKNKIDEKLEEICKFCRPGDQEFASSGTLAIVADFSEIYTMEDYKKKIGDKLEGYDIGVVVLNAGMGLMGPFVELTDKEAERLYTINSSHVFFCAKIFAPMLVARYKKDKVRSGIIVTSSGLGARPMSGTITYSAAKSFASFLAQGLSYELKDEVDVLSYEAGEVVTKMLPNKKGADSRTITPDRAADVCFRDLGMQPLTRGSFRHEFWMLFMDNLPLYWIQALFFKVSQGVIKKKRKH